MIIQHRPHLAGIVGPVGGQSPDRTRLQPRGDQLGEFVVEEPTLAVFGLVPGIGKEHPQLGDPGLGSKVAQPLDGIGLDDPDVLDLVLLQLGQDPRDRRTVDLEGQHVEVRAGRGHRGQ
ncbi:hypothetical protein GCM10027613_10200 [Microlunatus endophyticus]